MSADVPDLSALATAAVAMHEFYTSLRAAGFDRDEALTIIVGMVANRGDG